MHQLDVKADEEALELEVEVERLLHEQEAETKRQMVHSERPCQPSGENVTFAKESRKHSEKTTSTKLEEQCENSNAIPLLDPNCPNQEVKTTVNDISGIPTS